MEKTTVVARVDEPHCYSDRTPRQEIAILTQYNKYLPFTPDDCPRPMIVRIGSSEYAGLLRYTGSNGFGIPAHLDNHSVRLSDALGKAGFKRGHLELLVEHERITVVRQLSVHGEA